MAIAIIVDILARAYKSYVEAERSKRDQSKDHEIRKLRDENERLKLKVEELEKKPKT
jgi:hypothetical protein